MASGAAYLGDARDIVIMFSICQLIGARLRLITTLAMWWRLFRKPRELTPIPHEQASESLRELSDAQTARTAKIVDELCAELGANHIALQTKISVDGLHWPQDADS